MDADLKEVAVKVARRYAMRVWWIDEKELAQEATCAVLKAMRPGGPYDASCGVPRSAYAWRAAVLHLRAYLWKQSAPVHAPHHKLTQLRGVHRDGLVESSHPAVLATTIDGKRAFMKGKHVQLVADEDVDALFEEKRWTEEVRSQVDYLLDKLGADSGVAARVVVMEEEPAAVARELDLPIDRVYRTARAARSLLRDNAYLYELLKEKGT